MSSDAARKVMIAVDHSDGSKHAFEFALDNIVRDGDVLHIVHAVRPQVQPFGECIVMLARSQELENDGH